MKHILSFSFPHAHFADNLKKKHFLHVYYVVPSRAVLVIMVPQEELRMMPRIITGGSAPQKDGEMTSTLAFPASHMSLVLAGCLPCGSGLGLEGNFSLPAQCRVFMERDLDEDLLPVW